MKRILFLIISSLILIACAVNHKEVIILKKLDQFDSQEENKQLGIDLINYKYYAFFKQEFPDFTNAVLSNITWQYFIMDSNKEVSFRLILTNDAVQYKDRITKYFQETVDKQVKRQVADKELFDTAIDITLEHFAQLNNHDHDGFWEGTSEIFRQLTTKDSFFESIKSRDTIPEFGDKPILYCKQYYEKLPRTDETEFYVITFTFENDKNITEQLTYHYEEGKLKIVGYDSFVPN